MRRSKAPSVLKEAKRLCNYNNFEEKGNCSDPEDEQYSWGSRDYTGKLGESSNENKRIFNVVWRDVSTKKHKTWKGDGTLEVNDVCLKAVLKDETGKYLGCSTKINNNNLIPDFQMVIGGKEIEIQNEIRDKDQLDELRTRQAKNRNWISSEDLIDEKNKPKGAFKFNPTLVLIGPKETSVTKMHLGTEKQNLNFNYVTDEIQEPVSHSETNVSKNKPYTTGFYRELICFLRPSELQQHLFKKVLEYSNSIKPDSTLDKMQCLDMGLVLQYICNHPSLIKQKATTNKLMHFLIPVLPDWTEMGTFDSAKLEFVQYFLTDLKNYHAETCIIFATNLNVLNMLQGLCDFINIKCLRLGTGPSEVFESQHLIKFCSSESTQVLLVSSMQMLNKFNLFAYCNKLIIFEDVYKNLNNCRPENGRDLTIYNLVTAFSIEEILLLDTNKNDNIENLLVELTDLIKTENDCCYLHSKIECDCFKSTDKIFNSNNIFMKDWKHFKNPFDMNLLKISSLENSSDNIISIFCKTN